MAAISFIFRLLILLSIFTLCKSQFNWTDTWNTRCTYSLYVGTGAWAAAGTNATVTLGLHFDQGMSIIYVDLVGYGRYLNNDQYDYLEPGHIDMFTLHGPCEDTINLCSVNFSSDSFKVPAPHNKNIDVNDAIKRAWYITFVEITVSSLGKTSRKYSFDLFSWIGPPPYKPFALKSYCKDHPPSKLSKAIIL